MRYLSEGTPSLRDVAKVPASLVRTRARGGRDELAASHLADGPAELYSPRSDSGAESSANCAQQSR